MVPFFRLSAFLFLSLSLTVLGTIPPEVRVQFESINRVLTQADQAYYHDHHSLMSDEAYDYLRSYHDDLVDEYPELEFAEASIFPTDSSYKSDHHRPVLSLRKAYSDEDVRKFIDRVGNRGKYLIEPKVDGVSIVIEYSHGKLVKAITRGDSLSGKNVTLAVIASGILPLDLNLSHQSLRIRGEIYIEKADFSELNLERMEIGEKSFSSARNAASGSLMLKNYPELANRRLKVLIFECLNARDFNLFSDREALEFVEGLGLPVIPFSWVEQSGDVLERIALERTKRAQLPYETDGLVLKVDDLRRREELGQTKKYPRWAIARKFRESPIVTRVLGIEYSISDRGRRTPVAMLEPIQIGGATVKRASLHSDSFVESMGVFVGAQVKVIRAGGVVPEIVGVVESEEP